MTTDVYETLRREVLARLDGTGLDPERDQDQVRDLLGATVEEYQQKAHLGDGLSLADPKATVDRLVRSVMGRSPLRELLERDDVEEIFIEGDKVTYLEAGGALRSSPVPTSESENRQTIEQLIAATDRRLDASNPVAQARILDGSARLSVVIPPIADRLSATVRRYALRRQTLESLVSLGSLTAQASDFLAAAMRASASIIVSGPPGAG
ncbi:MAG TPA: ATPase, T2SS/T4P/T4SS family, partial [Acidimicrobiia bacterium]